MLREVSRDLLLPLLRVRELRLDFLEEATIRPFVAGSALRAAICHPLSVGRRSVAGGQRCFCDTHAGLRSSPPMTMGDLAERIGAVLAKSSERRVGLVIGAQARGETGFWHRGSLPDGPGTIFEIGSITKTFTATLLADMAGDGIVALGDPVQRHLPDGVWLPVRGREITLEDLATHRSGLPRLPKGLVWQALTRDRRDPYASLDEARLAAAIGATRPR
ncbi:MAG: serine hydrolase domain-containing protein, partial [Pseudonocardiaceae bacterium]